MIEESDRLKKLPLIKHKTEKRENEKNTKQYFEDKLGLIQNQKSGKNIQSLNTTHRNG